MTLAELIRGGLKHEPVGIATAIPAIPATVGVEKSGIVAKVARVAVANPGSAKPAPLYWPVAITEPGGRTVEVDTPSGWTLAEWQAYARRYHGTGGSRRDDRHTGPVQESRS